MTRNRIVVRVERSTEFASSTATDSPPRSEDDSNAIHNDTVPVRHKRSRRRYPSLRRHEPR